MAVRPTESKWSLSNESRFAILTLALGIGAVTAILSIVDMVLLTVCDAAIKPRV